MLWYCRQCYTKGEARDGTSIEMVEVDHFLVTGCRGRTVERAPLWVAPRAFAPCAKCGQMHEGTFIAHFADVLRYQFCCQACVAELDVTDMEIQAYGARGQIVFKSCFGELKPGLVHLHS